MNLFMESVMGTPVPVLGTVDDRHYRRDFNTLLCESSSYNRRQRQRAEKRRPKEKPTEFFPQFSMLPPELRQEIWSIALPSRIIAREYGWFLADPEFIHSSPAVARVCRESRAVANLHGGFRRLTRKRLGEDGYQYRIYTWYDTKRDLLENLAGWVLDGYEETPDVLRESRSTLINLVPKFLWRSEFGQPPVPDVFNDVDAWNSLDTLYVMVTNWEMVPHHRPYEMAWVINDEPAMLVPYPRDDNGESDEWKYFYAYLSHNHLDPIAGTRYISWIRKRMEGASEELKGVHAKLTARKARDLGLLHPGSSPDEVHELVERRGSDLLRMPRVCFVAGFWLEPDLRTMREWTIKYRCSQ